MKNFKNVFSLLGVVVSIFIIFGFVSAQKVYAATPTFSSAEITNSTLTTVDINVIGTDFFVVDISKITYNSQHPSLPANIHNPSSMTLTFNISVGTYISGPLVMDNNAVGDGSGAFNSMTPVTISVDSANPVAISTSPVDGSSGQSITDPIIITFSEPMNTSFGTVTLTPSVSLTPSWTSSSTVQENHGSSFSPSTPYTVVVSSFQDGVGNSIFANPYSSGFTTIATAPTASSAILNNSSGFPTTEVDLNITGANFSTFVNSGGVSTTNLTDLNNITYKGQHPTSANISGPTSMKATFDITGTSGIGTGTSGDLTISANTINDSFSNPNSSITVVSGSITDSASPIITSVSPANSATGVGLSDHIIIYFSEPLNISSFSSGSFSMAGGPSFSVGWSSSNTILTETPLTAYSASTVYNPQLSSSSGLIDLSSNPLYLPSSSYSWSFTTISAAPTASSAILNNSNPTTVDLTVTGANFSTFVNSGSSSTTNSADLNNITYKTQHPISANISGPTSMTMIFDVAGVNGIGTDTSGSLTIAANTINDSSSLNPNLLITINNGSITDSAAPVLLSFDSLTASGSYKNGDNIDIRANYSENVTAGAVPAVVVDLNSGASGFSLLTLSSNVIYSNYSVGASDNANPLDVSTVISQNVCDSHSNCLVTGTPFTPTVTNISPTKLIKVDNILPTLQSFSSTITPGRYKVGSVIDIIATYDEDLDPSSTLSVTLNVAGSPTLVMLRTSATTMEGTYTVSSGQNASPLLVNSISQSVYDMALNNQTSSSVPSGSNNLIGIIVDTNPPVISSVSINNSAMKVGDTVLVTITTISDPDTYTLSSGSIGGFTLGSFSWVSSTTYHATFTVTNGGTDVAASSDIPVSSLVLEDSALNLSSIYSTPISQSSDPIDANNPSDPTGSPVAGTYTSTQSVTLSSTGSNSIYYTLDGVTIPTCSSGTLSSGAISISSTTTIKAIGCDTAGNTSSVVTSTYTISTYTPPTTTTGGGGGGGGGYRSPVVTTATTTATGFTFKKDLKFPSTDKDVIELQKFLNNNGFIVSTSGLASKGFESIYFGSLTKKALIKFQIAKGITPASGNLGPITRAVINAMLSGKTIIPTKVVTPVTPPKTTPFTFFKKDLKFPTADKDVIELQKFLNNNGFIVATSGLASPGNEVNLFGSKTKAALIKFQEAKGISPANGELDMQTRLVVNEMLK